MPKPADLVYMQSVTGGTGDLALVAVQGKRTFSNAFSTGSGNTFDYFASHRASTQFEVGIGYCSAAGTLVRQSVYNNSLGTTAKIAFSTGTVDILNDIPASRQVQTTATAVTTGHAVVFEDADGTVIGSAGAAPYIVGGTDVAVADGGTGASNAATARTNLELGTMSTQNANTVNISGGTIAGSTISGGLIQNTTISGADITGSTMTGGTITGTTITGGLISGTTLSGADITGSTMTNGTINGSTITSAQITGSTMNTGTITNTTITSASYRPGEIFWYGSSTPPSFAFACDGSAVSRTVYSRLFAVVSTRFGPGNGSTSFNLPDLESASRFIRAGTPGVTQADGAPDIDGTFLPLTSYGSAMGGGSYTGAFSTGNTVNHSFQGNLGASGRHLRFESSNDDLTYSATNSEVKPVNIALQPCIAY